MCVRGCVPLCLCLPFVEGGRVSLRVTHTRVWAMHNAIPGPSSAPLAPYPPYPTSSLPPPHPLSPYLSLPPWPLPLHTRLVCPAVFHRPTSPLSACACHRVCCAARYGLRLCGRVTAGLTPGCVGVTRREGPPVSKPPLSLPLPRVVPPLRRPTPPYPPLCTLPTHTIARTPFGTLLRRGTS